MNSFSFSNGRDSLKYKHETGFGDSFFRCINGTLKNSSSSTSPLSDLYRKKINFISAQAEMVKLFNIANSTNTATDLPTYCMLIAS